MAAIEMNGTTTSCYERAFDDLAGERLLNLEFEMLGIMKPHTSNNCGIHSNYIFLQEIKYHVGFNVQVFSEALKTEHLQLFTHESCLFSKHIPIALFVKILYLLNHS